jgi:uncharacterized protein (DUF302 family)
MAANGVITVKSGFSAAETIDRLADIVQRAGLLVFARIDHGANAKEIDAPLRPTELLIFGNPKGGTPLMQDRQLSGLDLPMKALAWEDGEGVVWLSYDDAHWIAERHGLGDASSNAVAAIAAGMQKVIAAAAGTDQP